MYLLIKYKHYIFFQGDGLVWENL